MWSRDSKAEMARIADEMRDAIYELIDTLQENAGQKTAGGKSGPLFPDIEGVDKLPVLFADLSVEVQKFQMSLAGGREDLDRWTKSLAESVRTIEGAAPGGAAYTTTSRQPSEPPRPDSPIAPVAMPQQAPAVGPGQAVPFAREFKERMGAMRGHLSELESKPGQTPAQHAGQPDPKQLNLTLRGLQQYLTNPWGFSFNAAARGIGQFAMNTFGAGGLIAGGAALAGLYGAKKLVEFPEEQRADNERRIEEVIRPKARLNGELMGALTGHEIANLVRDMEIANRTSGSSRGLLTGQQRLKDDLKEQDIALTNIGNQWESFKTGLGRGVANWTKGVFEWFNSGKTEHDNEVAAMLRDFQGWALANPFADWKKEAGRVWSMFNLKKVEAAAGGPIGQQMIQIASGVRIVNPRMHRVGGGMAVIFEPAIPRER